MLLRPYLLFPPFYAIIKATNMGKAACPGSDRGDEEARTAGIMG